MKWLDTEKRVHRLLVVAITCLALLGGWRCMPLVPRPDCQLLYYNQTDSLPRGIYLRVPQRELQDGDYVIYEPTETVKSLACERGWLEPGTKFLKQVGAVAGESYEIEPDTLQFRATDRYIGQVFERDREGRPMPELRGRFLVPEGEFLPVGTNPRSFDGRYAGTVPLGNIRARVVPIITGTWMP